MPIGVRGGGAELDAGWWRWRVCGVAGGPESMDYLRRSATEAQPGFGLEVELDSHWVSVRVWVQVRIRARIESPDFELEVEFGFESKTCALKGKRLGFHPRIHFRASPIPP